jgi:hypothetical protein
MENTHKKSIRKKSTEENTHSTTKKTTEENTHSTTNFVQGLRSDFLKHGRAPEPAVRLSIYLAR